MQFLKSIFFLYALLFLTVCTRTETATTRAKYKILTIKQLLEDYKLKTGRYPSMDEGLTALIKNNEIDESRKKVLDPWGHPFHYQVPGKNNPESYDLWTYGADDSPGGNGSDTDVMNW